MDNTNEVVIVTTADGQTKEFDGTHKNVWKAARRFLRNTGRHIVESFVREQHPNHTTVRPAETVKSRDEIINEVMGIK